MKKASRLRLLPVFLLLAAPVAGRSRLAEPPLGRATPSCSLQTPEIVKIRLENSDLEKTSRLLQEAFGISASPRSGAGAERLPGGVPSTGGDSVAGLPSASLEIDTLPQEHLLVVKGSSDQVAFIRSFLREFDQAPGSSLLLKRVLLRHLPAPQAVKAMTDLFSPEPRPSAEHGKESGAAPHLPRLLADEQGGFVIVAASVGEMEILLPVLEELDHPAPLGTTVKRYRLRRANPVRVKESLESFFRQEPAPPVPLGETRIAPEAPGLPAPSPPPRPADAPVSLGSVSIVADPASASILVKAPSDTLPVIEALILALDASPEGALPYEKEPPPKRPAPGPRQSAGRPRPHR